MNVPEIERRMSRDLQAVLVQLRVHHGEAESEPTKGDFFDAAQIIEHREGRHLHAGRLTERARRLAAALERIREGTYGVCTHCGDRIARARVTAMPEAETCVRCEEAREARPRAAVSGEAPHRHPWPASGVFRPHSRR